MHINIDKDTISLLKEIEVGKCLIADFNMTSKDGSKEKMTGEFCRIGENEWQINAKMFGEDMKGTISIKSIKDIEFHS